MWRDEAQTIAISRQPFPTGILEALRQDGNSPLFYMPEHFVIGGRDAPLRELRDRSISVICGALLIPLAFVICGRVGGHAPAALLASTWVAFAPILIDL